MGNREEFHQHFTILEVTDDSSFHDVKDSYLHLKNLYSSDSRIFSSFSNNSGLKKKKEFLLQIENSYKILKKYFKEEEKIKLTNTEQRVLENKIPEFEIYSGNSLRLIREVLGIDLEEVSFASGISITHLRNIEAEQYDFLPPKGYIKAFIRKYAEFLSLDPIKASNDYINNMEKKQKE